MSDGGRLREFLTGPPAEISRPGFLGRVAGLMPAPMVGASRGAATAALSVRSRRQFSELLGSPPVRLNLGCGFVPAAGWTNVDLVGANADIYWDLRHGIPLPDNSVQAIFHEHLLEHLPMAVGLSFTEECRRVLAPGAVLRVVVPDAERLINAYVQRDAGLYRRFPTGLVGVQHLFYDWGHRAMYDVETLTTLLLAAGFSTAEERQFGESAVGDPPDSEVRRIESIYVEAVK